MWAPPELEGLQDLSNEFGWGLDVHTTSDFPKDTQVVADDHVLTFDEQDWVLFLSQVELAHEYV